MTRAEASDEPAVLGITEMPEGYGVLGDERADAPVEMPVKASGRRVVPEGEKAATPVVTRATVPGRRVVLGIGAVKWAAVKGVGDLRVWPPFPEPAGSHGACRVMSPPGSVDGAPRAGGRP